VGRQTTDTIPEHHLVHVVVQERARVTDIDGRFHLVAGQHPHFEASLIADREGTELVDGDK
jgi:hypothetical protein